MKLTLAHLSDAHLGPLPRFPVRHWNVKRGLGFLNWHRNRRDAHLPAALDAILADVHARHPDHVAVTGDLVNIGLPDEYEAALAWLGRVGPPDRVTVVPGNHDIYTRLASHPGHRRWQPYMTGHEPMPPSSPAFPFVRRLGRLALIGLNSAVPTPPFVAAGHLGTDQLQALANTLDRLGAEGLVRVVLIHHPPLPGQASRMKALRDADALAAVLARHGAELVLHGHNHRSELHHHPAPAGRIPVVGVPSASLGHPHKQEPLARYHLFHIDLTSGALAIDCEARGLTTPGGAVVAIDRRRITSPDPVRAS